MAKKYAPWAVNFAVVFFLAVILCVPAGLQMIWNLAFSAPFDLPRMSYWQAIGGCAFLFFFGMFFKKNAGRR